MPGQKYGKITNEWKIVFPDLYIIKRKLISFVENFKLIGTL